MLRHINEEGYDGEENEEIDDYSDLFPTFKKLTFNISHGILIYVWTDPSIDGCHSRTDHKSAQEIPRL